MHEVKKDIMVYPRLELPEDPDKNIWSYYPITRVTPIVLDEFLVVILQIPLMDKSLKMNLYKVHNLPSLHPELEIEFTYQLESKYLAISVDGKHAALPSADEIQLCQMTQGFICTLNTALYPVQTIDWCVYAIYIRDTKKIRDFCMVDTKVRHANLAINLDGYVWAISTLATSDLFIRCIDTNYHQTITSPLTLVYIGNGCEGYCNTIFIPAKTDITNRPALIKRKEYLLQFNKVYQNITRYGMWASLGLPKLTKDQISKLAINLAEVPPMVLKHLNDRIQQIGEDYPWSVHPNIVLAALLGAIILGAIALIFSLWRIKGLRTKVKRMVPYHPKPHKKRFPLRKFLRKSRNRPTTTYKRAPSPSPSLSVLYQTDAEKVAFRRPLDISQPSSRETDTLLCIPEEGQEATTSFFRPSPPPPRSGDTEAAVQLIKKAQMQMQQEGKNLSGYNKYMTGRNTVKMKMRSKDT